MDEKEYPDYPSTSKKHLSAKARQEARAKAGRLKLDKSQAIPFRKDNDDPGCSVGSATRP